MTPTPLIVPAGSGESLQVLADKIRVLACASQTASKYEVFELTGAQDSGPPPHSHAWDEAYFMLEGEVDVCVGQISQRIRAGDFVLAPGGVVHTFRIASPSSRFVVLTSGEGAGEFFRAMDRDIGFPPPSFEAVCELAIQKGLTLAA